MEKAYIDRTPGMSTPPEVTTGHSRIDDVTWPAARPMDQSGLDIKPIPQVCEIRGRDVINV